MFFRFHRKAKEASNGGENVRKKIITIAFAIFVVFVFISPVLAENPNKMPVAVALLPIGSGIDYSTMVLWTSEGGIAHLDYVHSWGTLDIYLNGVETYINVPYNNIISGNYNPKTMVGNWKYDEVWTLPGGTLVGTAHATTYGGSLLSYKELKADILLHGTGAYEGQVLSMSFDYIKGVNLPIYEGYWLTP
jgi:hypothetical protein